MSQEENFYNLMNGIEKKFNQKVNYNEFYEFYSDAIVYMKLLNIIPKNDFTSKRIKLIGRNLAISIFFASKNFFEESQILLRQVLDLTNLIIYGSNHILEIEQIDKGKHDQIGNVRSEIEKKLPNNVKPDLKAIYRNLSSVVHATIYEILTSTKSLEENWYDKQKLGHWKHDFKITLELSSCLIRSWFKSNYAKLDLQDRAIFENKFKELKKFEK